MTTLARASGISTNAIYGATFAFGAALAGLADGARAPVRYVTLEDPRAAQLKVIRMDRRWFPARKCKRDDALGIWPCASIAAGPPPAPPMPAATGFAATGDPRIDRLAPSLVTVNFDMPYSVSGVTEKNYHGTGLIVDTQRGLVVVDRNTVPLALGDVRITFDGTVEVPGKVEFIHPLHNLAVVSRNPSATRRFGPRRSRVASFAPATMYGWWDSAAIRRSCRSGPRCRASIPSHSPCRAPCDSATAIWRR